jgi:hypothetical protein
VPPPTQDRPSRPRTLLRLLQAAAALLAALALLLAGGAARANGGAELAQASVQRAEGEVRLDFAVRLALPQAVEDALRRGVPVYFVAEARLLRDRWYWRDERVARASRQWRVAYQPLTSTWRVGQGGLQQTVPSLAEALSLVTRASGWRLADAAQVDPDSRYYVEFAWRLDTSQLPGPMQSGLGGQAEWNLGVDRTLRLE